MLTLAKDSTNTEPILKSEAFVGDGDTTVFTFNNLIGTDITKVMFLDAQWLDGSIQDSATYTLTATDITFAQAPGLFTQSYTAAGSETTLQLTHTDFIAITSITKNGTALAAGTDYSVSSTGLITFVSALAANDDIEVEYKSHVIVVCMTDGEFIFNDYAILPSSSNVTDRTLTQQLYIVETSQSAYNSVSVDIVDYVSGAGASKDWFTLSLDDTTYQEPPLGIGSIPLGGSTSFYIKAVVPQQSIAVNLNDIAIRIHGLSVGS